MKAPSDSLKGILLGIGVGPGDPDLLTLRAVKYLKEADIVLAAASSNNEQSIALSIARPYLRQDIEILKLDFPMTRDRDVLESAWAHNAKITLEQINAGKKAAFLTLGDPLIYSTFGYLMRTLKNMKPDISICIAPGITSFQEAAARTTSILCEGKNTLHILPGILEEKQLQSYLNADDNIVILKAYRNISIISKCLKDAERDENCIFISKLGMQGEIIKKGISEIEKPNYLSLIISTSN